MDNYIFYDFKISYNKFKLLNKNNTFNNKYINFNDIDDKNKSCFLTIPFYSDIYIKTNINHSNIDAFYNNIYMDNDIIIRETLDFKGYKHINNNNSKLKFLKSTCINIKFLKMFKETYYLKFYIIPKNTINNIGISCENYLFQKMYGSNISLTTYKSISNIFYIQLKNKIDINLNKIIFPIYLNLKKSEYYVTMKFYKINDNKYYMYLNDILNFKNIYDENHCDCNDCKKIDQDIIISKIFGICNYKLKRIYKEYMKIGLDKSISINLKNDFLIEYNLFQSIVFSFDDLEIINNNYKKNKSDSLIYDINLIDIYKHYE